MTIGASKSIAPVRLALRLEEASQALGVSYDFFRGRIAPELRIVRIGRVRVVPITELEKWLDRHAVYALDI